MHSETRNDLLGCLECLTEIDELSVYVVVPLLCVAAVFVCGIALYHLIVDPHTATIASTSDYLSINPDNWLPPTKS